MSIILELLLYGPFSISLLHLKKNSTHPISQIQDTYQIYILKITSQCLSFHKDNIVNMLWLR